MQKYSEVIGKDVVCFPDGKKIGEVKELVFLAEKLEFAGIILGQGSFEISKRVVAREDIVSIEKAVAIKSLSCPRRVRPGKAGNVFGSPANIKGLPVCAANMGEIGFIEDILFDYRTGRVEGIELSDGFVQDVINGRKLMPLIGKVEIAEEHMLVSREAVEEMMDSGGGLKKILKKGVKGFE